MRYADAMCLSTLKGYKLLGQMVITRWVPSPKTRGRTAVRGSVLCREEPEGGTKRPQNTTNNHSRVNGIESGLHTCKAQ